MSEVQLSQTPQRKISSYLKQEGDTTPVVRQDSEEVGGTAVVRQESESAELKGAASLNKDADLENNAKLASIKFETKPSMSDIQDFTPSELRRFKWEGIRVLVGGFLIHLILGTFYLWGGIVQYIASYLLFRDEASELQTAKAVFPFMLLTMAITMTIGVKVSARFGYRLMPLLTMIVFAAVVFSVSYAQSFWSFIIVYAVLLGFATGLVYMTPIACGMRYYPGRKGLVSGIIIGGFGFGTLIFNQVARVLINPDNIKPSIHLTQGGNANSYYDHEVADNVPSALRILSLIYLIVGVIGALMLKYPTRTPQDVANARQAAAGTAKPEPASCPTVFQALTTVQFPLLFLMIFLSSWYGLFMANNYKAYGMIRIPDDTFLTTVGSVGSAINGCFRPAAGILMDKIGFKKVLALDMIIQAIFVATLDSIAANKGAYFFWYLVSMATEGSLFSLFPAVFSKIWGRKMGPTLYGYGFFGYAVSNISSFFIGKFNTKDIGWTGLYWIGFAFSVATILCLFALNENRDWTQQAKAYEDKVQAQAQAKGQHTASATIKA